MGADLSVCPEDPIQHLTHDLITLAQADSSSPKDDREDHKSNLTRSKLTLGMLSARMKARKQTKVPEAVSEPFCFRSEEPFLRVHSAPTISQQHTVNKSFDGATVNTPSKFHVDQDLTVALKARRSARER